MKVNLQNLTENLHSRYTEFLLSNPGTLVYYSLGYRDLIEKTLQCKSHYFIALDENDSIIGALPIMIFNNARFGPIANSLPFFGSNGLFVIDRNLTIIEQNYVRTQLMNSCLSYLESIKCAASTFITNPFNRESARMGL